MPLKPKSEQNWQAAEEFIASVSNTKEVTCWTYPAWIESEEAEKNDLSWKTVIPTLRGTEDARVFAHTREDLGRSYVNVWHSFYNGYLEDKLYEENDQKKMLIYCVNKIIAENRLWTGHRAQNS